MKPYPPNSQRHIREGKKHSIHLKRRRCNFLAAPVKYISRTIKLSSARRKTSKSFNRLIKSAQLFSIRANIDGSIAFSREMRLCPLRKVERATKLMQFTVCVFVRSGPEIRCSSGVHTYTLYMSAIYGFWMQSKGNDYKPLLLWYKWPRWVATQ
jgi:hypothetical protein